jgi:hypothetical protein
METVMTSPAELTSPSGEVLCGCKGCARARKPLQDAIQRVRELHKEMNGPADDLTCSACAVDELNYPEYPCPTIKALEGEQ